MSFETVRADVRLAELGLAPTREKARSLIMAGVVYKNGIKLEKAGAQVKPSDVLSVTDNALPFVSRGGLKLLKAIEKYGLKLDGATAIDIGASTGGFTDCMLQHGAQKVYSVDVGYGQLDWKLRNDERVVVMERTNARTITPDMFGEEISFASIDVSFISVRLILPALHGCLNDSATAVVLVKPQFEAGREKVGKNGVVREKETHREVFKTVAEFAQNNGFAVKELDFSPITGPKGNREFLLILKKTDNATEKMPRDLLESKIRNVVDEAHETLGREEE